MRLVRGLCGLLLASCVGTLTACDTGGPPPLDRTDLVSDLATRIKQAGSLNYLAEYQVSGGAVASVAQSAQTEQIAYRYPGGSLIISPAGTTTCGARPATCVTTAAPSTGTPVPGLNALPQHGLVHADLVSSLLTTAALDLSTGYRQYESTISGQPATCVEVSRMTSPVTNAFEACVITDGVVGSFSGMVNGDFVEFALTHYTRDLPPDAFATASPSPDVR